MLLTAADACMNRDELTRVHAHDLNYILDELENANSPYRSSDMRKRHSPCAHVRTHARTRDTHKTNATYNSTKKATNTLTAAITHEDTQV